MNRQFWRETWQLVTRSHPAYNGRNVLAAAAGRTPSTGHSWLDDEPTPTDERKMVMTLSTPAAILTRRLAKRQGVEPPEIVRRGLMLLDLFTNLEPGQDLVILDRETGEAKRLKPLWDDPDRGIPTVLRPR